ncbi:unnamed protein product [Sphagnum jensenii]|uniref:PRTase-CE domain-containing protein n=2 Tax=Sphagnum jensenii TaxID=128206 RepID=A0ABP1A1C7_9BRYO
MFQSFAPIGMIQRDLDFFRFPEVMGGVEHFVLVDDVSYSGEQLERFITNFRQEVVSVFDPEQRRIHLHVVVAAKQHNNALDDYIQEERKINANFKVSVYTGHVFLHPSWRQDVGEHLASLVDQYLLNYDQGYAEEDIGRALVYFDHKLADDTSVYPIFLSRFISGCETERVYPVQPICPPVPYKRLDYIKPDFFNSDVLVAESLVQSLFISSRAERDIGKLFSKSV